MKITPVLMIGALAFAVAACSSGRGAPDEFEVVSNRSLVVPPESTLAPPRPGNAENREITPSVIAKEVLFPEKEVTEKEPPQGAEAAILKKLKYASNVDVRSNVGTPDVNVTKKRLFLAEIMAMKDGTYAPDNISVKRTSGD